VQAHASAYGVLDLFVAGAGFDVAGAFLLARGLTATPERAARRLVQSRNSLARFDVRSAEDYADGRIGRASLILGFLLQTLAYVLLAHKGTESLSHTWGAYVGLVASGVAAVLLVLAIARMAHPWLRDRWLVEFARIDNYGYVHTDPSADELFSFGQILNIRPYEREVADPEAYAQRVFKTRVRDPRDDWNERPSNFQPFAPLDDRHGYVSEYPKGRWGLSWRGLKRERGDLPPPPGP
jgi:hypothetical protein